MDGLAAPSLGFPWGLRAAGIIQRIARFWFSCEAENSGETQIRRGTLVEVPRL